MAAGIYFNSPSCKPLSQFSGRKQESLAEQLLGCKIRTFPCSYYPTRPTYSAVGNISRLMLPWEYPFDILFCIEIFFCYYSSISWKTTSWSVYALTMQEFTAMSRERSIVFNKFGGSRKTCSKLKLICMTLCTHAVFSLRQGMFFDWIFLFLYVCMVFWEQSRNPLLAN